VQDPYPEEVEKQDVLTILESYVNNYDHSDDRSIWFEKIRALSVKLGYAAKPNDYKKNPSLYKGHVGHVSTVIRIALTGRASSPDLWEIQQIMGEKQAMERIDKAVSTL
jgi:glutamyl-tRNA synthetase